MHAGRVVLALLTVVLTAAPGHAQVDCSNPDNLCTGDPCVIGAVELPVSCVVDFGTRTVIVSRRLRLPPDGVLSFSAGGFTVSGSIVNQHTATSSASVSLQATGSIVVEKTIRLRGNADLTLDAGGDLAWSRRISVGGETATILLQADGDVTAEGPVDVVRTFNSFGTVQIEAGGRLTVRRVRTRRGDAIVRGATELHVVGIVDAWGFETAPATVELTSSGGPVIIDGVAMASGSGSAGVAGNVVVTGASIVLVRGRVGADGDVGGSVSLSSTGGDVVVDGRVSAAGGDGGLVTVSAADFAAIDGNGTVDASGDDPASSGGGAGTIDITGADARLASGGVLIARSASRPGGTIRISATAGDLMIAGALLAGTGASAGGNSIGGTIEGDASGNLTAGGVFQCLDAAVSGGCIGLSAGGTLDASGGTFDKPIVASCP